MGLRIAVIGTTGEGKSPLVRRMIGAGDRNIWVYDVQNEYGKMTGKGNQKFPGLDLSKNPYEKRARYASVNMNINTFIKIALTKMNCDIVFEEASQFFYGKKLPDGLMALIHNEGHTNNNYFFIFHSIRIFPPTLLSDGVDKIILFKTLDEKEDVEKKSKKLLPYWNEVMKRKNKEPVIFNWSRK